MKLLDNPSEDLRPQFDRFKTEWERLRGVDAKELALLEKRIQREYVVARNNRARPKSESTTVSKGAIVENTPKTAPKLPTRPPDKAFQAWQIRELVGISKQGEIADTMTKQGIPATQGQVSKWLAAVEKWRTAGGLMPEVGTLNGEPQSVDPDILDMGARQDGLTPRQRPRRDSDADE